MRKLLALLLLSVPSFAATCGYINGGTPGVSTETTPDIIYGTKCTLPAGTWSVSTISVYYGTDTTNHVNLGIYDAATATTNTPLCETGQFTASAGWNTVAVGAGCSSLAAGDYYVANIKSDGTVYYDTGGTSIFKNPGVCCSFVPLTFGPSSIQFSQYFTYSASGGGGTVRRRGAVINK